MANLSWLKLPRCFAAKSEKHLSDEQILALIDNEADGSRTADSMHHLESCWRCLARKQHLESTICQLVEYRQELLAPYLPPPPGGEERFLARLDQQQSGIERAWLPRFSRWLHLSAIPMMTPFLASAAVIAVAAALLLFIWHRNLPNISAHEFLERAATADLSHAGKGEPGVVYQRIAIRAPHTTLERALYHDVQRRRRPKPQKLDSGEAQLKMSLQIAGVDWDDPLSAANYRDWHDRHEIESDRVTRAGNGGLTLTSTAADGIVSEESLTVRAGDFHAVSRTVTIRDVGTVEIAELNYAVLGWNAVNEGIFEPLEPAVPGRAPHAALAVALPPTHAELDEAELSARLALNRMNADSTEQLTIAQLRTAVQVKGLVETDARKRELLTQLRQIPHVTASIFSVEELKAQQEPATPASIQAYSAVAGPSPLEIFLRGQGAGPDRVSQLSQQLLDAVLAIQQESGALSELQQRFGGDDDLGSGAKASLRELTMSHANRLLANLEKEESLLRDAGLLPEGSPPAPASSTLTVAAAENAALSKSLILGNSPNPRPAQSIGAGLANAMQQLRAIVSSLIAENDTQPPKPRTDH